MHLSCASESLWYFIKPAASLSLTVSALPLLIRVAIESKGGAL